MTSIREFLKNISVEELPEAGTVICTKEEDYLARSQTMTYPPHMYYQPEVIAENMGVKAPPQVHQDVQERVRKIGGALDGVSLNGEGHSKGPSYIPSNDRENRRGRG